ncbi:hypothetical protein RYX36_010143 [Vicia faba]
MDFEPEFPIPTRKEMETITNYLAVEPDFIAAENFFTTRRHILLRKHAVSIIAKLSRSIVRDTDAFIPYLAMNYFDRFLSRHKMILMDVEGFTDAAKVRLIAIACLTLSAKMRTGYFSVNQLLDKLFLEMDVSISYLKVMRMELMILDELHWKMRSVTAFCFLNNYNAYFKRFGSFKRRCINEIIVQAQGEVAFIHYLPSHIALSAFLAAAKIAYPSKFKEIAIHIESKIDLQGQVKECVKKMVNLCYRLNIEIEAPGSEICTASSKVVAVSEEKTKEVGTSEIKEIQQSSDEGAFVVDSSEEKEETPLISQRRDKGKMETSHLQEDVEVLSDKTEVAAEEIEVEKRRLFKGKAVDVTETCDDDKARVEAIIQRAVEKGAEAQAQPRMEGYISEIIELADQPKRQMDFELKWPIIVPSLEEEIEDAQPQESTTISLKIPGTRRNVNFGCGTCNVS